MLHLVVSDPSSANSATKSPNNTPLSNAPKPPPWACSRSLRLAQKQQLLWLTNPAAVVLVEQLVDALLEAARAG